MRMDSCAPDSPVWSTYYYLLNEASCLRLQPRKPPTNPLALAAAEEIWKCQDGLIESDQITKHGMAVVIERICFPDGEK